MSTENETSGKTRSEKHMKQLKTKNGRKKGCLIALFVVLVIAILAVGAVIMAVLNIKPPSIEHIIYGTEQQEERADGVYSVLVVGTDKVGLNTDTILVASLDSVNNQASVMSIPRDTMSNVNRNVKKINAAYSIGAKNGKGNVENLKDEVSDLIGFEVDNYVVVNLTAFEELIDAIGGVTINVPRNMNYDDPYQDLHIHIDKGLQTLNGKQAVGFVRYRSGYAEGDIGRVKAQQLFIEALVNQVATPATVTKMPKLINIVLDNMDTDLTNGELLWFGKEVLEIDMATNFNMFVLPGEPQYVRGVSYYLPNESEILAIVNEYFNPKETPITSLNVVDMAAIRQREAERQAALTEEQRRKEEELKQQAENQVIILDENGNPVETIPSGGAEGDISGEQTDNPSGNGQEEQNGQNETDVSGENVVTGDNKGTDQQITQQGGIPGEVLQGQEVPEMPSNQNTEAASPTDNTGSNTAKQQPVETHPNTIPGEVLKQDAM